MKKIVFCDIDGTLIDGFNNIRDVSKNNCEAINDLGDDTYFILTSGRAKFMLNDSIINLNADGYILSNGAYIEFGGNVLKNDYYSDNQIAIIEEYNKRNNGMHLLFNQEGYYSPYENETLVKELLSNLGIDDKYNLKLNSGNYQFIVEILKDENSAIKFVDSFKNQYKIKRQYKSIAYDINQINDDKGEAVKFLIKYLDVDYNNTYCIGDSENDLEMMNVVKYPIAMGNAKEMIKKVASYITDKIDEDGVAKAFKYFKLI